jgi:diguanylate cyclase (GGDEF)-like protein
MGVLLLASFVWLFSIFSAWPSIGLDAGIQQVSILQTAQAADGNASYADVKAGRVTFLPYRKFKPRGWPVHLWLRFAVSTDERQDRRRWLIVLPRWMESATLYREDAAPEQTGMYVRFDRRPVDADYPAFRIRDRDFDGAPLLINLVYFPDRPLAIRIISDDAQTRYMEAIHSIEGFFVGVLVAIGILNIFVFVTTRDKNAFWFVCFIASVLMVEFSTSDVIDRFFWTDLGLSTRLLEFAFRLCAVGALIMFERTFLHTKIEAPRLDRLLVAYFWILAAFQTAELIVPGGNAIAPLVELLQLLGIGFFVYVAIARWRAGYTPARFFVLAFIPLAAGVVPSIIYDNSHPPLNAFWFLAENGGELGTVVQALVLSFSVADRIRILERLQRRIRRKLRKMESLAHFDVLTGLLNRARFSELLNSAVKQAVAADGGFALLFCDLDGFKGVNDHFGHHYGDEVLHAVAQRLLHVLRADDVICRLGGDEFAVLIEGADEGVAVRVEETLRATLDDPIIIEGSTMPVGISIGHAIFPRDGFSAQALLEFSDARMYENKQRRKALAGGDGDV